MKIKEKRFVMNKNEWTIRLVQKGIIHICDQKALNTHSYSVSGKDQSLDFEENEGILKMDSLSIKINEGIQFFQNDFLLTEIKEIDYSEKTALDDTLLKMEGHQGINHEEVSYVLSLSALETTSFYGLGDKTGFLDKKGYEFVNWNTDDPAPHEECFKSLYKSIPFFMAHDKSDYGFFLDNTYKSLFSFQKNNQDVQIAVADGAINFYFFYGDSLKEILANYTLLTGRVPLPQEWTLGYQQSRWSYGSEQEVRDLAKRFEDEKIPLDVIHLDIDYMDHYKVFTTSKENFPTFEEMVSDLKKDGIKVVTIIDPGVKVEKDYFVYEEGVKNDFFARKDNQIYQNVVWPGDSVYPSFTNREVREWWGDNVKILLDKGVEGIWNDMNEPASFKGPLPEDVLFKGENGWLAHKEIHNVYGHTMALATYEGFKKWTNKRPYIITRACFSGTQKYSTIWTGDNHSLWSHLQLAIPQLCNLGLSGYAFAGADIGGFGSDCTGELLARFIEVGIFSPLCRNHSAYGTKRQEPWCFGKEILDIYRKFVNLRYKLIPYFYDLFKEHQQTGLPILRPLVLEYPEDPNVLNLNTEFMVGSNLLVSPVVHPGETKKLCYLPKGKWVNYDTKEIYPGNQYIIVDAPLDIVPIFVRYGSILPTEAPTLHFKEIKELVLEIYGNDASYLHYQDNGIDFSYETGRYNQYLFTVSDGNFSTKMIHEGYPIYEKITLKKVID